MFSVLSLTVASLIVVWHNAAAPKDISAPRRVPSNSALSASLTREITHSEALNGAGSGSLTAAGAPTANGHGHGHGPHGHAHGHHSGGRGPDPIAQKVRLPVSAQHVCS